MFFTPDASQNPAAESPRVRRAGRGIFQALVARRRFHWPLLTALALGALSVPRLKSQQPIQKTPASTSPDAGSASSSAKPAESARDLHPLAPIAAAGPESAAEASRTRLRITSTPAGIPFELLASAYETPHAKVLKSGETPVTVEGLRPGAYRIRLSPLGQAPRAASVQVAARGVTEFQQEFPHGMVKVQSQPRGAEIFCDQHLVGLAPISVPLLPGKHTVGARWAGRSATVRTIRLVAEAEQTVTFDFHQSAKPRSKLRPPKSEKEEKPVWDKVGQSLKKFFKL